ncbi:enoyl-CoA hydratase/isomerase family protein [Streptomyces reniochalinae]|uniref:3-hydroxyisobutyryl-CoA hydrolase n=1 Tax=Streptomyces reniochalinae TaxID=2250578 RepID=A0A367E6I6_9ACTN|nr:enoyl-CoA hydratase/isomerase family protein [Streptomyces reniochalinae]RCG13676.1 enoyl-CoA hydratase/isomerase family protein [Streptomyces reniochalinae]
MAEPAPHVPSGLRATHDGTLGRIILDRPKALNALTLDTVQVLETTLLAWRSEPLTAVTIESSDERAFCAGGDIRTIRQNTIDGRQQSSLEFFATEYRVNALLADYPHPVVSLIDGICMGGGMGLSVHGPFRVVTEGAVLAMPETSIGFFPDVGATHFLPRLPGATGMYLALTGARINAADALALGLATHFCGSARLAEIPDLLRTRGHRSVDQVLNTICSPPSVNAELAHHRAAVDDVFAADSVHTIRQRLRAAKDPWLHEQAHMLDTVSRQSLMLTFDLISHGKERNLATCLTAELRAALQTVATPDFLEGVRAALVDKDRSPNWADEPSYQGVDQAGAPFWHPARDLVSTAQTATPWQPASSITT